MLTTLSITLVQSVTELRDIFEYVSLWHNLLYKTETTERKKPTKRHLRGN